METFQLTVITWNRKIYDGPATICNVTTLEGSIGLEAHHESFLAVLQSDSEVSYRADDGQSGSAKIKSGVLSFENNTCTVTVESAK